MPADELLKTYVILYNYGVESGDFTPLTELFDDSSVLEFEDPKIGKFVGRELIGGMFRRQAPSTKIELMKIEINSDSATADFSHEENIEVRTGGLKLTEKGNKISHLLVTL